MSNLYSVIVRLLAQRYEVSFRDARHDMISIRLQRRDSKHRVQSEMTLDIYEDHAVNALEVMAQAIEDDPSAENPALPWSSWNSIEKNDELARENERLRHRYADISTIIQEEIAPHIKAIAASVEARI